jgi:hypothetical protein
MSRKINWSDAPFNWPAQPELDEKALNSPQPCSHGSGCRYAGPCAFVHKGEEGTGRRLFPARTVDGKEQGACVRLIGSPGFYERRRLRLSWPEWCAKKGYQAPAAAVEASVSSGNWPALPYVPVAASQRSETGLFPAGWSMQQTMLQQAMLQQAMFQQAMLQGQEAARAAAAAKEASAKATLELRNDYGQKLFDKLLPYVADLQKSMAENWPKSATAGKLTGIFLELGKDEWDEMLRDDDVMYERVGEALDVLNAAVNA